MGLHPKGSQVLHTLRDVELFLDQLAASNGVLPPVPDPATVNLRGRVGIAITNMEQSLDLSALRDAAQALVKKLRTMLYAQNEVAAELEAVERVLLTPEPKAGETT